MECLSLDRATGTQSNLVEAERIVSSPRNPHFQSRVTPDGHSRFRASGVLEGDCLMCHLNGYRLDRRNAQVASRNYRWAPLPVQDSARLPAAWSPGEGKGVWEFSSRPAVTYSWKTACSPVMAGFRADSSAQRSRRALASSAMGPCRRSVPGPSTARVTMSMQRRDSGVWTVTPWPRRGREEGSAIASAELLPPAITGRPA